MKKTISLVACLIVLALIFRGYDFDLFTKTLAHQVERNSFRIIQRPANPSLVKSSAKHVESPAKELTRSQLKRSDFNLIKSMTNSELYCYLKKNFQEILTQGQVKIQSGNYINLQTNKAGLYLWVHSSHCPKDHYSILRISETGVIEAKLNCDKTSLGQLSLESQLQFAILESKAGPTQINLAISGVGRFVLECAGAGLFLTREGQFFRTLDGYLEDARGCRALKNTSKSDEIQLLVIPESGNKPDSDGCFGTRPSNCIAITEMTDSKNIDADWIDSTYLRLNSPLTLPLQLKHTKVYQDSLENLDDPDRGPTGIQNWDNIESVSGYINCIQ